jgi:hypothetical protein
MKYLVTVLTILSMVVMPCLAQDDAACVSETNALMDDNQAIGDAYDAMETALKVAITGGPMDFCDIGRAECSINVGSYSSSLKTTCDAENGQIVESNVNATCSGDVLTNVTQSEFAITVEAAPLCAGKSCDPTAIPTEIEDQFTTIFETILAEINTAFDGTLECISQIEPATSATSGALATTIWVSAAAGATLVASILM